MKFSRKIHGRFCIKFPQNKMTGQRHRLSRIFSGIAVLKDIQAYSFYMYITDWRIFPEELKPKEKKVRKYTTSRNIKPNISPRKKMKDINKTLEVCNLI